MNPSVWAWCFFNFSWGNKCDFLFRYFSVRTNKLYNIYFMKIVFLLILFCLKIGVRIQIVSVKEKSTFIDQLYIELGPKSLYKFINGFVSSDMKRTLHAYR